MAIATTAMEDSTTDIVNALINKGVLTEEEGALLTKGRTNEIDVQKKKEKKAWTSQINIRGYFQNRVANTISGDEGFVLWPDSSGVGGDDRSGGNNGTNFRIRRARIIFSGQVDDHLGFYIQPDFAKGGDNSTQLRDAYGDIFVDKAKVHRFRVGQSKVPYGYENLQSSSNRLALDRSDSTNSAVRDERDMGVFYYYTPKEIQGLFKEITDLGLKHTGNYGMFGAGFYQGQGANNNDLNDNWHRVARLTYPWKTETGQIFEVGIQGYTCKYVRSTSKYNQLGNKTGLWSTLPTQTTPGVDNNDRNGFKDERVAVSFRMYPQPWGLEGEWNWGSTPGLDMAENKVKNKSLNGGYIQGSYFVKDVSMFNSNIGHLIPFVKWEYFDGYNKAEANAPKTM